MFKGEKDFVVIEVLKGTSTKSNRPYMMLKVANPETYENFTLSCDVTRNYADFSKGEKVKLKIDLVDFYGKTQIMVTDIIAAAYAK